MGPRGVAVAQHLGDARSAAGNRPASRRATRHALQNTAGQPGLSERRGGPAVHRDVERRRRGGLAVFLATESSRRSGIQGCVKPPPIWQHSEGDSYSGARIANDSKDGSSGLFEGSKAQWGIGRSAL